MVNFTKLQKIILFSIAGLLLIILFLTAIMFATNNGAIAKNLRKTDPSPEKLLTNSQKEGLSTDIYTKIGQLRCTTADDPIVTVVITPYFEYPKKDKAFFEELSAKNNKLQQIIREYIKQNTRESLAQKTEKNIKEDILKEFNENLILGKIDTLYFSEYIFFE